MTYDTILFDLDGTLTDPAIGITNSVAHALYKFGFEVKDKTTLYPFIGPPLVDSFQKYYGLSEEDAKRAVDYYREYFSTKGIYENKVYPGIADLLQALKQANKTVSLANTKLALATTKPELYAEQILKHFDLFDYFDCVAGSNMDGTRSQKGEIIPYALHRLGKTGQRAIMVGDREHDIIGAKQSGIASIGVLYGYGSREELTKAGADYLAATVLELGHILLNGEG